MLGLGLLYLTLVPGDIVLLDNLGVHKVSGIQQMLARRRIRLRYLPPYSPDLAPIESCWSKLKTHCAQPRPGRATRLTRQLPKHWPPSRPRMRTAGSLTVAMPYSNLETAIGMLSPHLDGPTRFDSHAGSFEPQPRPSATWNF
jgi:transposase